MKQAQFIAEIEDQVTFDTPGSFEIVFGAYRVKDSWFAFPIDDMRPESVFPIEVIQETTSKGFKAWRVKGTEKTTFGSVQPCDNRGKTFYIGRSVVNHFDNLRRQLEIEKEKVAKRALKTGDANAPVEDPELGDA